MKHIITKQPFAEEFLDWESDEGGTTFDISDEPPIISFRDAPYESAEMKQLLSLTEPDEKAPPGSDDVSYKSSKVFPEWVLKNSNWKSTAKTNEEANTVSDILKLDKNKRNPDQNSMVIKWLMSVWKIAFTMGFKRCGSMLKAFEYVSYQPGENIIEEGSFQYLRIAAVANLPGKHSMIYYWLRDYGFGYADVERYHPRL